FFAIQICFKAFSKLQKVLTLKNFHKNPVFQYFKDMKLSNDLYNFLTYTVSETLPFFYFKIGLRALHFNKSSIKMFEDNPIGVTKKLL
ncbi:hypothetical protein, partial [uncultured Chryseobacterium sp.]|uniref:hypothetical protein n=1 Tax=uncultured Chryseobacterium sp. TaxID=259322 RepID=UPI0025DB7906